MLVFLHPLSLLGIDLFELPSPLDSSRGSIPSVVEEPSLLPTPVDGDIPSNIGVDANETDTSTDSNAEDVEVEEEEKDGGSVEEEDGDQEKEEEYKNGGEEEEDSVGDDEEEASTDSLRLASNAEDGEVEEEEKDGGSIEEEDGDQDEEEEYENGGEEEEDSKEDEEGEEENGTRSRKRRRSSSSSNNSRRNNHRYSAERQTLSRDESGDDDDDEEEEEEGNATASDVSLGDESLEVVAVPHSTSKRGSRASRKRQRQARPRRWKLAHKVGNKYNIFLTLTELCSYVKYIIITIRMSTMVIDRKNGYKFGFWTNLVNGTVYRCNNRKCKATIVVNGKIFILRNEFPFSELLMLRSR